MSDEAALRALDWYLQSSDGQGLLAQKTGLSGPVFFNAHPINALKAREGVFAIQPQRPVYLSLERAGWSVAADRNRPGENRSGGLVLLDRARALNEAWLNRMAKSLADGTDIAIIGTKTTGIDALRKRLAKAGCAVESTSKHHARILRIIMDETAWRVFGQFENAPSAGLFNTGGLDVGSRLLIETFTARIAGQVADFCAGSGVLAQAVLDHGTCRSMSLYESNHDAVEWSRNHVQPGNCPTEFHWHDLVAEPVSERFDAIIMNPPFHTARAAQPDIGQAIIRRAAKALVKGGVLRMVANIALPYEKTLSQHFRGFRQIHAQNGFKVLEAWV